MSLLSVGAGLSLVMHWTKLTATIYAAVLKLLALPFATFFLLSFFAVDGMAAHIALLYAAVPCAGNSYILARQMGGDAQAMASIITWTTLISALTISLWMS